MHQRFLIPLFAFVLVVSPALAAPAWKKELGPSKPGSHAALPPGKLVFNLSWKDIVNSARLEFDIGKPGAHKPGVTVIKSTGKSMGVGGAIFPYDGHGWSEINSRTLRPIKLTATENKNKMVIKTENHFFHNRMTFKETTRKPKILNKRQWRETVETHEFKQAPVYDIGSAILFIRSQRLRQGDRINLMLHPYSSPYLLKAKVLGREKREGKNCIKLSLELFKINRDNLTLKPYKKLKAPAILWFSDDKLRLPVEVRAKVFIGDIRATLQGFEKP